MTPRWIIIYEFIVSKGRQFETLYGFIVSQGSQLIRNQHKLLEKKCNCSGIIQVSTIRRFNRNLLTHYRKIQSRTSYTHFLTNRGFPRDLTLQSLHNIILYPYFPLTTLFISLIPPKTVILHAITLQ